MTSQSTNVRGYCFRRWLVTSAAVMCCRRFTSAWGFSLVPTPSANTRREPWPIDRTRASFSNSPDLPNLWRSDSIRPVVGLRVPFDVQVESRSVCLNGVKARNQDQWSDETGKDRSAFFQNIKSKLTFPYGSFERRKAVTNRQRLTKVLQMISRWMMFPYRWLRRRRPRRRQDDVDGPPSSAAPSTTVEHSSRTVDVAEPVQAEEAVVSATVTSATAAPRSRTPTASQETSSRVGKRPTIAGDRWAVSSMDLSGQWEILVTDEFKQQYDKYLTLLGQPMLVRSVALSIVGLTTEETIQSDNGRELFIRGRNVRGSWERSLVSSGADEANSTYEPTFIPIVTADSETVYSESWWENNGTAHRSWLRGVQKYGGGDFESLRYLDGDVLVCESTFHPNDPAREMASVTWRFKRQGS